MRIDLHTHSTMSDGTQSPRDVMAAATEAGLDVVALTDHDTTAGWDEARDAAADVGIEFVPGIEVSCRHRGMSVHLLAYWIDPLHPQLLEMFGATQTSRVGRARTIVDKLAAEFPITWETVERIAGGAATVGRPHIADALVEAGVVSTRTEAFDELLHNDSRFYVPHYAPDLVEAISLLRTTGGVPVVAHPGAQARGRILKDKDFVTMAEAGLVGIEIDHRDHDPEQRERLEAIRQPLSLVRTGSSDYHGTGKVNQLGENLTSPDSYAALRAARG